MRPMLATAAPPDSPPPDGALWAHEVKWDGMRVLADVSNGQLRLSSRAERDVSVTFPELAGLAEAFGDVQLDGEVVAFTAGRPDFGALADRMHVRDEARARALAERSPTSFVVFDVLRLYGVPLLGRSFDDRRQTLERLEFGCTADQDAALAWQVPATFEDGAALLEATGANGLEGIVSKRRASTYQPGVRSRDWIKRAHRSTQTCVVGGWRPQVGTTNTPGALLLGLPDGAGGLTFLGRVGAGIGPSAAADLTRWLTPLARPGSPFGADLAAVDIRGTNWVQPQVCVEVAHLGLGRGGRLRHPAYRGRRTDVVLEELIREP